MSWVHAGSVAVDAGIVMVGDPCYTLHANKDENFVKYFGKDWEGFCDKLNPLDATGALAIDGNTSVVVGGFGGDGIYPVHILKGRNGLVKAMVVTFNDVTEGDMLDLVDTLTEANEVDEDDDNDD